jgi:hypothetical protein
MIMRKGILAAVAALLLLAGCASVPNIALDKGGRAPLKTVALIRMGESQYFLVRDLSGMAALGGLVGGLVQGSLDDQRTKQYLQAVNDRKVKFSERIVADLQSEFAKAGIQMQYVPDQAARLAADKKSDDYSAIKTDKDAILVVWFGATGFVNTAKLSTEYQPWLIVNARLLDPKTKAILYQKTFNLGYAAKIDNAVFINLDQKYQFGNFDDLMGRVDFSIEALSAGDQLAAEHIVADLR